MILGGGPSLAQVDLSLLAGRHVIAVNNAYKLGPWDVMFFGDGGWLRAERERLVSFTGIKVTVAKEHLDEPGLLVVKRSRGRFGISEDPGVLTWNLHSGACAINLAVHLGVRRIVLLGYDMRKIDGQSNWHADYPPQPPSKNPYPRFLMPFEAIARDLARLQVEVVNATPGSALTAWPIVDPAGALGTVGACA